MPDYLTDKDGGALPLLDTVKKFFPDFDQYKFCDTEANIRELLSYIKVSHLYDALVIGLKDITTENQTVYNINSNCKILFVAIEYMPFQMVILFDGCIRDFFEEDFDNEKVKWFLEKILYQS